MTKNLDDHLKEAAPGPPLQAAHRRALKSSLRAELEHRRRRRFPPLAAGFCALFLALFLSGRGHDLGSQGWQLRFRGEDARGIRDYRALVGNMRFSVLGSEESVERGLRINEQDWQGMEAREGRLTAVTGFTVGDSTYFTPIYEYATEAGHQKVSQSLRFPRWQEPVEAEAFNQMDNITLIQLDLAEGRYHHAGTETRFVDGLPVRFEKYLIETDRFDRVIFWRGKPIQ